MKKTILTAVIACVAMLGTTAMAQQPQNTDQTCTSATCNAPKKDKASKKLFNPYNEVFAGLNLTPEQQAKVEKINAERQAKFLARRGQKQQGRQQADSTFRAQRAQEQRDYLTAVKGVLTPDQYVLFLEDIVVNGPQQPQMGQMGRGRQGKDMGKHGQRPQHNGQRPQRNQQAQR